jgi:hypothetical protein
LRFFTIQQLKDVFALEAVAVGMTQKSRIGAATVAKPVAPAYMTRA